MRERLRFWLGGLVFVALGGFLVVVPALAQQESGFTESFDDPELPGWEHSPEAVVVDGVLRVNPNNFALRVGEWVDLTLTVRARRTGSAELVVGYYFRDVDSYFVHLFEDSVVLERLEGGTPTLLGEASLEKVEPGNWMNLRVVVAGGEHEIFLDDVSVVKATDPDPLPPGGILFTVGGESAVEFDDMIVTAGIVGPETGAQDGTPPPAEATPTTATVAEAPSGGIGGVIDELFTRQVSTLELQTFIINLALAAVLAFLLGRVYIHWGTSLSNRRAFAANFVMLTITTTFIILVVRSSVALSLGLVGALSIVRFRAAIKEPEELTYLFLAIGLGIGLGDNQRLITIFAFAAATLVLGLMRLFRATQADVNLHLTVASHGSDRIDLEEMMRVIEPHTSKIKLLRLDENETTLEMSFLVEFRRLSDLSHAKAAIREASDSVDLTFLDNQGIW